METWMPFAVAGSAALGLILAFVLSRLVMKTDPGDERMQEISRSIQEGARTFIKREYTYVALFVAAMFVLLCITLRDYNGWMVGLCYLFGAACSLAAGFIGLHVATKANSRTTQAAKDGAGKALTVSFRSGAVMGFTVAGLGLLGITICYIVFQLWVSDSHFATNIINGIPVKVTSADIILGFSLGASSVALFARCGGGIFTKAADVGADLVGKVESHIPEDDPRNPAVIADNVGDNVGDVCGMGADLFESYVAAIVSSIALAAVGTTLSLNMGWGEKGMVLPLAIAGAGMLCSILGSFFVRSEKGGKFAQRALTLATYTSAVLATVASFFLVWWIAGWDNIGLFWSVLVGIVAGVFIGITSEYFTSDHYNPVKKLAESAKTGSATVIIKGLGLGMLSTIVPVVVICVAMGVAFVTGSHVMEAGGGIYGIALAALGMLSTTGMVVSVDAYGPVVDNAGGIAQMADLDPEVREITDGLDSVGNTTAAIGKGFAIGSAALAALALFSAYAQKTGLVGIDIIGDYKFLAGLIGGAMIPFVFSALTLNAVGAAAFRVVEEVRRQFREIPGLKEGKEGAKADYSKCVDITTKAAIGHMIIPGLIAVIAPLLVGWWDIQALTGLLAGALVTGFLMAIFMANAGGAWDNAKKYIESGELGGKGTPTHDAAVVGDTVGDPLKDTSGPSMNILIKVMTVVALVFVPLFI